MYLVKADKLSLIVKYIDAQSIASAISYIFEKENKTNIFSAAP